MWQHERQTGWGKRRFAVVSAQNSLFLSAYLLTMAWFLYEQMGTYFRPTLCFLYGNLKCPNGGPNLEAVTPKIEKQNWAEEFRKLWNIWLYTWKCPCSSVAALYKGLWKIQQNTSRSTVRLPKSQSWAEFLRPLLSRSTTLPVPSLGQQVCTQPPPENLSQHQRRCVNTWGIGQMKIPHLHSGLKWVWRRLSWLKEWSQMLLLTVINQVTIGNQFLGHTDLVLGSDLSSVVG